MTNRMHSTFSLPPFAISTQENPMGLPQINTNKNSLVSYPLRYPEPITTTQKTDRLSILEWRIGVQDTISVSLLDKIATLRGEMLEHLKFCRHLEKEQTKNKDGFANELRLLTDAIRNMGKGIQNFEENVREKWKSVNTAADTLRNLENHHVSSLKDVRNRISRSDQAITTLSHRINQIGDEIRSVTEKHKRDLSEMANAFQSKDKKTDDFSAELERSRENATTTIRRFEDSIKQHLTELEHRFNQRLGDLHQQVVHATAECTEERSRLEERTMNAITKAIDAVQQRVTTVERKAEEIKVDEELTGRMDDTESELDNFKQQVLKTFKELESRINRMADDQFDQQRKCIDEIRDEMRQSLVAMHDTITNMKSVMENKIRMSEENLQLELAQLRKLVVLV
ncbi:Subfamily M23B non-peptidase ue (M23 family) [Fasciola hepatica]|uniref:Subfamily M23B non-peptidase ue (M23 family) n=1 Tax=Fasciola hepatica TaxID=6192 RepID=A0A4E0RXZ1_FASHE|nr:Subfamily M23B non-peptidase ue (M23 family) [Fasciola hepatica]